MKYFKSHPRLSLCFVILIPFIIGITTHIYLKYKKERVVYIGLLHALTGPLSATEQSILSFELFIIDKMNKNGGVLGHRISPIVRDFGGDAELAKRATQELIEKDKVSAIFDGGSSSTIFALQSILEKHNKMFFFSLNNIGMLVSPNIVFCNSAINNQVLPALEESIRLFGKKVFLLGRKSISKNKTASYDSTVCHGVVAEYLRMNNCEVVGNIYLSENDENKTKEAITTIKNSGASFILCTSSSILNVQIVKAYHQEEVKIPIVWTRFEFSHIPLVGKEKLKNHLFTNSYTRVINTPINKNFVNEITTALGFAQAISTHEVSALSALQLWVEAAKKCKSFETNKIRSALRDRIFLDTPQGPLTLDPETLYAYKKSVLVKYNPYGVLEFLWYSPNPMKAEPFPNFKPKDFWLKMLESLESGEDLPVHSTIKVNNSPASTSVASLDNGKELSVPANTKINNSPASPPSADAPIAKEKP